MAQYFSIPANRLHPLPADMSDLQAVLVEPVATAVHAGRLVDDLRGKAVAVLGAGTIGLLVLAVVRRLGARRVVMTDLLPAKRRHALHRGADAVVDAASPDLPARVRAELGESADVVFDCVSTQSTVDDAIHCAFKGGTVVVVGVPATPVTVPLPQIQNWQVRVQGSATYLPIDFAAAIDMIRGGLVRVEDYVTAVFDVSEASAAFTAAGTGNEIKVVVSLDED